MESKDTDCSPPIESTRTEPPDGITAVGPTRRQRPAVAPGRNLNLEISLLGIAGFLVAINWQVIVPVLPVHLSRIGYSDTMVGLLVSLYSLAMAVVEFRVGRITSFLGGRATILWGLVVFAGAMAWLAVGRTSAEVAVALLLIGAARATMWTPLHAAVAAAASEETRGRAFGVFWFLTSVGFLVGPLVGGAVATWFHGRAAFYLGGAIALVTIPLIFTITNPGRPKKKVHVSAGAIVRDPIQFRIGLANLIHYSISSIWSTFLPLYAVAQGLSVFTIGEIFALQGLTYALIQLPTGRLTDRFGPEPLIIPSLIGRALVSVITPLLHTNGGLLLAGAVYGLGGGLVPVTFTTLVARHTTSERYTTAMGVYNSSGDFGFFIGPVIGGAGALLGVAAPFILCGPLGIAAIAVGANLKALIERNDR
jgi:MFS family permease